MKVAIYIRVSRSDLNPDNQRLQLIDYARMKQWEFELFEEIQSTRKTRPIKEKVLAMIRKGQFDGVLIYKLDRWARSLQELIMNIDEIKNRGKQFIVLTQPIDTTNSSGMLMLQILGAFAEFEREIIRERTMAGLERARAKGKKLGRPRGTSKPMIKDLEKVFNLIKEGKSSRDIALIMNTSRHRVRQAIITINKLNNGAISGEVLNKM